jgi:hypothetical protein
MSWWRAMIKHRLYFTGKNSLQIKFSRDLLIFVSLNNTRPPTSTAAALAALFFHMKESRYNFSFKFYNPAVLIKCRADNHYQPITSSFNDCIGQRKTFSSCWFSLSWSKVQLFQFRCDFLFRNRSSFSMFSSALSIVICSIILEAYSHDSRHVLQFLGKKKERITII